MLALAALAVPAAGGATRDGDGLIVFSSARTAALIPFEARSIDLGTGRSRRIGVLSLADPYANANANAWSPGARALASTGPNRDLYVSRPGAPLSRVVRGRVDSTPFWSPSGRRLAFFGLEKGRFSVFVVASNGRGLRRVAARVASHRDDVPTERISWSPDGRQLVFRAHGRLVVLRLATGRMRRLSTGRGRPGAAAWSPNGRKIAFRAQVPGERATIRTLDLVTGAVRRVLIGTGQPLWSPDGQRLAIQQKHRLVVLGVGVVATYSAFTAPPAWSPDSRRLVFWNRRDLVVASARAKATRRLTNELKRFSVAVGPTWSASGDVVYAGRRRDAGDLDLHVVRPDGTGARALTANDVRETDPVWSRDGRRIAYIRAREPRGSDVYVMDADGTDQQRVIADGSAPTWSPDGDRLAFERAGDIWTVEVDGSDAVQLTSGPDTDSQPDWSAAGTEIAFSRDPDRGTSELYAIHVATGGLRRITTESSRNVGCHGNSARAPAWSPDDRFIAYEVERGGSPTCGPSRGHDVSIYVIETDGAGRRFLTNGGYSDPIADDGALTPTWSPDGTKLAFVSSVTDPEPEYDDRVRIGIVAVSSGPFRLITPKSYFAHSPSWGP